MPVPLQEALGLKEIVITNNEDAPFLKDTEEAPWNSICHLKSNIHLKIAGYGS